ASRGRARLRSAAGGAAGAHRARAGLRLSDHPTAAKAPLRPPLHPPAQLSTRPRAGRAVVLDHPLRPLGAPRPQGLIPPRLPEALAKFARAGPSRYHGRMHDLAIVGGGPAGLLTARRCAEAGLDVTVLEEHEHIGEPVHCTGIISLETATLTKISEDVVLNRLRRACLIAPGGGSCHVPWTGSGTEELLAVDRAQFDRSLAEQAQRAGATVRTGARVDEIASDADGVT